MGKKYTNWDYINRDYTNLGGKRTTKITPIRTSDGFIYKVIEVLYLDNQKVLIGFYANRLGKAISNIKNSYFDFQDRKEVYNARGAICYKIDLLERIQGDLERKKFYQTWEENKTQSR